MLPSVGGTQQRFSIISVAEPLVFLVQTQLLCTVIPGLIVKYFILTSNLQCYKTNFDADVLSQ